MAKSRKRWVRDLLAKREAVERAVGVPIGDMLGCGHFGCVFKSTSPWVVKLTVDPTEGPIWATILWAIEENAGYGGDGFCRVKDIVRLKPDVGIGVRRKGRALYAIVREEVEPVYKWTPRQDLVPTPFTLERLGGEEQNEARVKEFDDTMFAIREYLAVGRVAQLLDRYRKSRSDWERQRLHHEGLVTGYPGQLRSDANEVLARRAERAAYGMSGPIGGPLGESLVMLAGMNIVLRDVHVMNIGWRIHECIGDDCAYTGSIVIFDPGHTPTAEKREIPERMVANGRWLG